MDIKPPDKIAQLGAQALVRLHVGLGQVKPHLSAIIEDAVFGAGQILAGQPEIQAVAGQPVEGLVGKALQEARQSLALDLFAVGFADHLDMAEGELPLAHAALIRGMVEIVQPQGLLEPRGIGLARDGQHDRVVVADIATSHQPRGIGQPVRMRIRRRPQHQQRRRQGPAGDHDDIGRQRAGRPGFRIVALDPLSHLDAGDGAPAGIGDQAFRIGPRQQGHVRMVAQCRIDRHDLGVGLAVRQAGIAVEAVAADAGAVGQGIPVGVLIQQHPDRQVERVVPLADQPVGQFLDARLVHDRGMGIGV